MRLRRFFLEVEVEQDVHDDHESALEERSEDAGAEYAHLQRIHPGDVVEVDVEEDRLVFYRRQRAEPGLVF